MRRQRYFAERSLLLQRRFSQGDYTAFLDALIEHLQNDQPLPNWVAELVWSQACSLYSTRDAQAAHTIQTEELFCREIDFHMRQRREHPTDKRRRVSGLACLLDYGTSEPGLHNAHVVTPLDVCEYVKEHFAPTDRAKVLKNRKKKIALPSAQSMLDVYRRWAKRKSGDQNSQNQSFDGDVK